MLNLILGVLAGSALGTLTFVSLLAAAARASHIDNVPNVADPAPARVFD